MKPNYFLKVSKDLFAIGLNPLELLIVSQVMEFETNTGDCFISDKVLAENFGVSESTITRTLKALEAREIIVRVTKNARGGKERHISVRQSKIDELIATRKMMLDKDSQQSNCLLSNVNLRVDNKQNDLIKDNLIDKERDNNSEVKPPKGALTSLGDCAEGEQLEEIAAYKLRAMGARYEFIGSDKVRIIDTGKVFRVYGY